MAYLGPKRRVFISFRQTDRAEVDSFIDRWSTREGVFTPRILGAGNNYDSIASADPDYTIGQIREKYLSDSTVTIVLLGACTHSRRYVDWEIKASLRQGEQSRPNGLIAILLPSQGERAHLPERFKLNWGANDSGYARYYQAPTSADSLGRWIEDAFGARSGRAHLISNPQETWKYNRKCEIHGVTH